MLRSCKSLENRQDDLSADEDMLENTKPNLISFSLSTSSSNHTVSVATNSGRGDTAESDCLTETGCGETGVRQLSCSEQFKGPSEVKSSNFDVSMSLVAEPPASVINHCNVSRENSKLFTKKVCTNCSKTENFQDNTSIKSASTLVHGSVRTSSLCNLYERNSRLNGMPRFASHPQLNSDQESKRSILSRSLSSISLKNRSHAYDHVESKVKHYIKQLKREKVERSEQVRESEVHVPHPREDSALIELQLEVKRLQCSLEERDLLLQEVQANYHSLLLQYGEAKNKLDQLRFTSVAPQRAMKSIQTQACSNTNHETSLVISYEHDKPVALAKLVHESKNQKTNPNDSALSIIESRKEQESVQNTELSSTEHSKLDFEAKKNNKLSMERSTSYSPEMATLKVSSWFCSLPWQPLPVPSCYGSLGSSGNVSNQQQDSGGASDTLHQNEDQKWLWLKNGPSRDEQPGGCSETTAEGASGRFLPVGECHCWTPKEVEDDALEGGRQSVESVKAASLEVLCVPPLDLKRLNSSVIPQDSSISKTHFLSEDSSTSVCSQHSSCGQKCSFEQMRVASEMSFETPTSYKSIAINHERAERAKADEMSSVSISLPGEPHNCGGGNELCLKSAFLESDHVEGMLGRKNDSRHCCLEKILHRCCIHHTPVCCLWPKTSSHQLLRCKQCPRRDSMVMSDSQMLLDLGQFLDGMSVCAEGLKKKSETIQRFLANLLDSPL